MKKLFFLSVVAALAMSFASCSPGSEETPQPEKVELNKATLSLVKGTGETLVATVYPADLSEKSRKITWESENPAIATVDENGRVEALAVGETTITVTTVTGGKTDTCPVTVTAAAVAVESVSIQEGDAISVPNGTTKQLTAVVSPATATNQNVTWESDDQTVATVSATGLVEAVGFGSATITVTTEDGAFTADCVVTVPTIAVESVSIQEGDAVSVPNGTTKQLTAVVSPATATNQNVTWESDDEAVATVGATGLVEAVGFGSATITVTTEDGAFTANCVVTVPAPVTAIDLKWKSASIEVEGSYTMTADVLPAEATVKDLRWTSDNIAIATVNETTGVVEGLAEGKATITATATDGSGVTASWKVTVMSVPLTEKCAEGTPRFGESLGTVSFLSDQTWTIPGSDLVWSDAVQASVATGRTAFQGSDQSGSTHYCDCRDGNAGYGDFFTWCTAIRFRAELCPDGWRIPTTADFIELDKALGGTGVNRTTYDNAYGTSFIVPQYVELWGGGLGGNCAATKPMYGSQVQAAGAVAYWIGRDVETTDVGKAKHLGYQKGSGYVYVDQSVSKGYGETLRCVR